MLRDIQSVEVLVCNRALLILIAVSQLPLKLKLYVSLWTSGRCAERLFRGNVSVSEYVPPERFRAAPEQIRYDTGNA